MGLKRIVDPAAMAVELAQAKKQVEIAASDTTHDDQLTRMIATATDDVERMTRRALITQQWRLTVDAVRDRMPLPRPPCASVQSVQCRDNAGVWQTHSPSYYELLSDESPATVYFTLLPWATSVLPQSYRINYTAGFGATHASIPEQFKNVIYELVAFRFMNRGDEVGTSYTNKIPNQIKWALDSLHCGAKYDYYGVKG